MGIDKQSFTFIKIAKELLNKSTFKSKVLFLGKPTLIVENSFDKSQYDLLFSNSIIKTVDIFSENQCDFTLDICSNKLNEKFDLIIDHGTLQHVYNPYEAIININSSLEIDGIIIHIVPISGYENFGYFQFSIDWFKEIYRESSSTIDIYLVNEAFPNKHIKVMGKFSNRLVGRWRLVVISKKVKDIFEPKFAQEFFVNEQPNIIKSNYNKFRARFAFLYTSFISFFKL